MFAIRTLTKINRSIVIRNTNFTRNFCVEKKNNGLNKTEPMIDFEDPIELPLPYYEDKVNEATDTKRARLLYQSRKRGMLENGLLLSTFAAKYLNTMSVEELVMYDKLINRPTNDWDIYYWATGVKPTPDEYDNEMMNKFKMHVRNDDRESRIRQPDLPQ